MASRATFRWLVGVIGASIVLTTGLLRPPTVLADPPATTPPPITPPGIERVELRKADERTFALGDGRFVTQFFTEPVFYQPDGSTSWEDIDTTFAPGDGNSAHVDKSAAKLDLSAADAAEGFLRLHGGGQNISFHLPDGVAPGRAGTEPVISADGAYVEYADFLPGGIGLRVFAHADGFKSFLVLPSRPTVTSFSFEIKAPGLALASEPDGTLAFRNAQGDIVGRIPRPFMLDSSEVEGRGGGLYSDAMTMSVTTLAGPAYLLTLTVDPTFLDSAVYPVYVDPTTTDFPTSQTTANDTFAASKYPNSNFKTYQRPDSPYYSELWHGNEPGTSYYSEIYIKFNDIRNTIGTVKVEDAELEMYPYWQYFHYTARPTWVRQITGTWDVDTLTWNNRPSVGDTDLGIAMTKEGQWNAIDLTSYVQNVVNGTWTNLGVMLNADNTGQGNWKRFISRNDNHSPDRKPHLSVTWSSFVPSAVDPDGIATASRVLTWEHDSVSIATSSQVEVTQSATCTTPVLASSGTLGASSTSWSIPTSVNLTPSQTYYWHIRAKYGVNTAWSGWSSCFSFVFETDLPVIANLSPDFDFTSERTIAWTYDDGDGLAATVGAQSAFQVQLASSSDFASVVADSGVITSPSTTWDIPAGVTLVDGAIYYLRVRVADQLVWSDWLETQMGWGSGDDGSGVDGSGDSDYVPPVETTTPAIPDGFIDLIAAGDPDALQEEVDEKYLDIAVFHQRQRKWCVLATLETMLWYVTSNDNDATMRSSAAKVYVNNGTKAAQQRLKWLVLAEKYGKVSQFYSGSYQPTTVFSGNGISTNYGWQAINDELKKMWGMTGYAQARPTDQWDYWNMATAPIGYLDPGRPSFTEVDWRREEWIWNQWGESHMALDRGTHAVAITGYRASSQDGNSLQVADPFYSSSQSITTSTTGGEIHFTNPKPGYSSDGDYGHKWPNMPLLQLFRALDLSVTGHKPVWY